MGKKCRRNKNEIRFELEPISKKNSFTGFLGNLWVGRVDYLNEHEGMSVGGEGSGFQGISE